VGVSWAGVAFDKRERDRAVEIVEQGIGPDQNRSWRQSVGQAGLCNTISRFQQC
jgi:hypothetical protein